jgi:uncharacterized repeat protein (TIGR03803 family)
LALGVTMKFLAQEGTSMPGKKHLAVFVAAFSVILGPLFTTTLLFAASKEKVLYSFGPSGVLGPTAGLSFDTSGNLYSTTYMGGDLNEGTVWELMHKTGGDWTEKILYDFGSDGGGPAAGVIVDAAGNLYGTTSRGGIHAAGTVFELTHKRDEKVLYSFCSLSSCPDGCSPLGGLLRDKAGNLNGTTASCGTSNQGTVFQLSKSGTETVLHSFAGGSSDGAFPAYTSLLMDAKGNLYGVTTQGGASNEGVVYKLSKSGKLTVLHSFAGGSTDGCNPDGTLAMDKHGNLYGTTTGCGSSDDGIVWKVSQKDSETVLHNFTGGSDGADPNGGVVIDMKGNLYGTTVNGGAYSAGTVFEVTPKAGGGATEKLLHSFGKGSDGTFPYAGLIFDASGNLYGTTYEGGAYDGGTVFEITP